MDTHKKHVLFVCTHNAARSQMAEGWLRALAGDRYEVHSAGTHPGQVHPLAIEVMREIEIDLTSHRSKSISELDQPMDFVVTVCDNAREACPYVPAREQNIHHGFPDPSSAPGTDEVRLAAFRRVRDDIGRWIRTTFQVT